MDDWLLKEHLRRTLGDFKFVEKDCFVQDPNGPGTIRGKRVILDTPELEPEPIEQKRKLRPAGPKVEFDSKNKIVGWYCRCDIFYDILSYRMCDICNTGRPSELDEAVEQTLRKRGLLKSREYFMPMDDAQKELHAKFFAEEKVLYKALDFEARRAHRLEIESICFQAKAYIASMDWVEREESESLHPTQREWLQNNKRTPNPNLTDAITVIKDRKKRVSKADKMLADMRTLGIANADELIANVEKHATKSKMDSISFVSSKPSTIVLSELCRTEQHEHCPAAFRVGETRYECKCKCHEAKPKELKPIDFDNFFGD